MIGAGTGIAGLRAHLLHRRKKKLGEAWLLFGERGRATDLYYGDDLKALAGRWHPGAHRSGVFARRDAQDAMSSIWWRSRAAISRRWVGRGASILVCGGLEMAAGVQEALIAILGEEKLDQMTQNGLYRRDIY